MAEMPTWHFTFEMPPELEPERRASSNAKRSRNRTQTFGQQTVVKDDMRMAGIEGLGGTVEHSQTLLSGSRTLIAVNDPTNIFKSCHLCMQTYSYAHEQEPFAVWTSSFMATLIKSKQGPNFVKHLTDV